jgi:hypothetical protein
MEIACSSATFIPIYHVIPKGHKLNIHSHVNFRYHGKVLSTILPFLYSSYHVSEAGLWWQELASDLNTPKDIYCSPKEEKDTTVFSVRVCIAKWCISVF